ncbi:hypothetical protein CC1G_05157 [Coprinopsis cinerea okayama7|uniref:Uncharacterized protein n=1 Tax=Coprinopsis cinerea (strain Okayama-7 / 130 / ATCC MYA-4618 / FGSC 9003) TaxID=240176 RepID=A8NG24_COPC7|nr:hypothetical protein CC1G_05157 [Coprinopsis cinerea okayama7\|eukprot:XP_001833457.1 hypothetical protein CC1G_05157 [Coprinopsis cinerea okayama7\
MRPTVARLVRVLPRSAVQLPESRIIPRPTPQYEELKKPTVLQLLEKQREEAGENWPSNIRIEPVIKKQVFKPVKPELRKTLKKMLKET